MDFRSIRRLNASMFRLPAFLIALAVVGMAIVACGPPDSVERSRTAMTQTNQAVQDAAAAAQAAAAAAEKARF